MVPLVPFTNFSISSQSDRTLLLTVAINATAPAINLTPGGTVIPGTPFGTPASNACTLGKTASVATYTSAGQVITYTYTITILGTEPTTSISVVDDQLGAVASCPASLDGAGTATCTATRTITPDDVNNARNFTNTATMSAMSDSVPFGCTSPAVTVNFVPHAELTLTKTGVPPLLVEKGEDVVWTFTLQNTGNVPLTSPYTIVDTDYVNNWTCAGAVSPLAAGASTTCTGLYALKQPDINREYITNGAKATAKYGATTVTSNSDSATVLIPELSLVVTWAPPSITALGQTITFTYSFTNHTSGNITQITIAPSRGTSVQCLATLASTATASCTQNYTGYNQTDMDAGFIINSVTADAKQKVSVNVANVSVPVTQTPLLQLTKTATPMAPPVGTDLHTAVQHHLPLHAEKHRQCDSPGPVWGDR